MNLLMAGMVPTMMLLKMRLGGASPASPAFWFVMSMALLVGAILAYPMNWWLVSYHLKHGMMTVRAAPMAGHEHTMQGAMPAASPAQPSMKMDEAPTPHPSIPVMTLLSFVALAAGIAIAWLSGSM
jgi:hypothetical protein